MSGLLAPQGGFAFRCAGLWTMAAQGPGFVPEALVWGDAGRIHGLGPYASCRGHVRADIVDLGDAILCPGLVNAHTHLGLSHLAAESLVLGQGFVSWVRSLVPRLNEPLPEDKLQVLVEELRESGTALVADVAGRNCAAVAKALVRAGLDYLLELEFFGFGASGPPPYGQWPLFGQELPESVWTEHVAAAGHALYSTSPDALVRARAWSRARGRPFSLHLAEDPGEVELLRSGGGDMADFYRRAGILPADFRPPGLSPTAYAASLGLLGPGTLAVHAVQLDDDDIQTLARSGASVCLCPRSNALLAVGRGPWEALLASGISVCLGTDGRCSNLDLDLWAELQYFKQNLKVELGMADLLAMVTRNAAAALGKSATHGLLAPGRGAVFSAVPPEFRE